MMGASQNLYRALLCERISARPLKPTKAMLNSNRLRRVRR